jgi:hypothetical protein
MTTSAAATVAVVYCEHAGAPMVLIIAPKALLPDPRFSVETDQIVFHGLVSLEMEHSMPELLKRPGWTSRCSSCVTMAVLV